MKKIYNTNSGVIKLVLALLLGLSFIACGSSGGDSSSGNNVTPTPTPSKVGEIQTIPLQVAIIYLVF